MPDASLALLTNLSSLDLSWNDEITDARISTLTSLTLLRLEDSEGCVTDQGIASLIRLTELHIVNYDNFSNDGNYLDRFDETASPERIDYERREFEVDRAEAPESAGRSRDYC